MSGEQLVLLLLEYGIGVRRSAPDLFELDEEFFEPRVAEEGALGEEDFARATV